MPDGRVPDPPDQHPARGQRQQPGHRSPDQSPKGRLHAARDGRKFAAAIGSGAIGSGKGSATMNATLDEIARKLSGSGQRRYGLHHVNQLEHALQTAWLAERAGDPDALVAASLLHDIGHMVHRLGDNPAARGTDDLHEELGHAYLCALFGPEVTEPVRLHVAAKRYLCAVEPDYFATLAADSVRSLALQGGPMSPAEAAAFAALPQADAAVRLRRYDDSAKVAGLETPDVAHFMPALERSLRR
jgi:phosphonate degradation associated HDIG domain protein